MVFVGKKQHGQSLLELIIAIGVITVGLFAVWTLFLANYRGEKKSRMDMIAFNLAREGVELVKNIRDSNWRHLAENAPCVYDGTTFDPCFWDSGLNAGHWIVRDILSAPLFLATADDGRLYQDEAGFYTHENSGQRSPFSRQLKIRDICCVDNDLRDLVCDDFDTEFIVKPETETCGESELKIGLDIVAEVDWDGNEKGPAIVESQIYNWH